MKMKFLSYKSVADVCRLMGWDAGDIKFYSRVQGAIMRGHSGDVVRWGRSFLLSKSNIDKLLKFLKQRYPEEV